MSELIGSRKQAHPDATIIGPAANEQITVTVVYEDSITARTNIEAFADRSGFTVSFEPTSAKLTGTTRDMETAFLVDLQDAHLPDGTQFRSRVPAGDTEAIIDIPEELQRDVIAVLGLDTRPQAEPHFVMHTDESVAPMYSASQVAQLYNFPTAIRGEGQCVAVIELGGGYSNADLQAAGIDPTNVYFVGVDGATNQYSGNPNSADGEVALDLQVIGQIAPACRIGNYTAPNTDQGFYDAVAAAINDTTNRPSAISISWGSAETNWTQQAITALNELFAIAYRAGFPVFVASGDNGSSDGTGSDAVDFPASGPNALGCGGTILPSIAQEAVWHDSGGGATGGGISKVFGAPAYQQSLGFTHRAVPDIAGDAAPSTGYAISINGRSYQFGGTSAVAPLWAAWAALAKEQTNSFLGDLHARFYALIGTAAFHDITSGNNGTQAAKVGFDTCTGCGTPNGSNLIAALMGGGPVPPPQTYSMVINGPLSATVGTLVTYTATLTPAASATYAWTINGATQASTVATFSFTPMVTMRSLINCKATIGAQVVSASKSLVVSPAPVNPCKAQVDTGFNVLQQAITQALIDDPANTDSYNLDKRCLTWAQQYFDQVLLAAGTSDTMTIAEAHQLVDDVPS